jgi:hypothetical protein
VNSVEGEPERHCVQRRGKPCRSLPNTDTPVFPRSDKSSGVPNTPYCQCSTQHLIDVDHRSQYPDLDEREEPKVGHSKRFTQYTLRSPVYWHPSHIAQLRRDGSFRSGDTDSPVTWTRNPRTTESSDASASIPSQGRRSFTALRRSGALQLGGPWPHSMLEMIKSRRNGL